MSPVASQPSASMTSAFSRGRLRYPVMRCGPRSRISPSAAIRISVPGRGWPTVPNTWSSGRTRQVAAEVSVSP